MDEVVARDRDDVSQLMLQLRKCVALDLAHALAADLQLAADLLKRRRLTVEAEAQLEDTTLTLREIADRFAHGTCTKCLRSLALRVEGVRVGEQITELTLAVGADGLVQRHRRFDGAERLLDVAQLETSRLGQLLPRRLLAARSLEPLAGAVELPRRSWT